MLLLNLRCAVLFLLSSHLARAACCDPFWHAYGGDNTSREISLVSSFPPCRFQRWWHARHRGHEKRHQHERSQNSAKMFYSAVYQQALYVYPSATNRSLSSSTTRRCGRSQGGETCIQAHTAIIVERAAARRGCMWRSEIVKVPQFTVPAAAPPRCGAFVSRSRVYLRSYV